MSETITKPKQIPFDLPARRAFGRDDFQVGESNRAAVGWIDSWPSWPAPVLVIQGNPASGKSHLAAVWREKTQATILKPESLTTMTAEEIFAKNNAFVLDGLDPWLGDHAAETTLFHLYNMLKEAQKTMLITMRMAPCHADFVIPDLASRFRAAPAVSIEAPDDDLLGAVLRKHFSDRQLSIGDDVINYLLPRMERSFAAIRDLAEAADHAALSEKRGISVPLMRKVLTELL